jgi:hypothetical protein
MPQDYVERLSARMRLGARYRGPRFTNWTHYTDPDRLDVACGQSAWVLGYLTGTLLGDASERSLHAGDELGLGCDELAPLIPGDVVSVTWK